MDAAGLQVDNRFEGELMFVHDGIGRYTIISVAVDVVEGHIQPLRELVLRPGWNTVSSNAQPDDTEDEEGLERFMADLVEDELLVMMKDGYGHYYRPEYDYNDIPGWRVEQGYQIKVSREAALSFTDFIRLSLVHRSSLKRDGN